MTYLINILTKHTMLLIINQDIMFFCSLSLQMILTFAITARVCVCVFVQAYFCGHTLHRL